MKRKKPLDILYFQIKVVDYCKKNAGILQFKKRNSSIKRSGKRTSKEFSVPGWLKIREKGKCIYWKRGKKKNENGMEIVA